MSEILASMRPGMERVQVRRDLAYKPGEGAPWLLDLYLPEDYQEGDTPRPAVIFIHGEAQVNTPTDMKDRGTFHQQLLIHFIMRWTRCERASGGTFIK